MIYNKTSKIIIITLFNLFLCLINAINSAAMFVNIQDAQNIAENWLKRSKGIISDEMDIKIREIVHYHGDIHGEPGYYAFFIEPKGFFYRSRGRQF